MHAKKGNSREAARPEHVELGSLLVRTSKGDAKAFEQLYRTLRPNVWLFLSRLASQAGEDVLDDLAQETFVRVWRHAPRFRRCGSANAFIMGVARNVFREYLAHRRRSKEVLVGDAVNLVGTQVPATGSDSGPADLVSIVLQAKESLPPKQRRAFELTVVRGLKAREAAVMLGCSPAQVMDRAYRARQYLKLRLGHMAKGILGMGQDHRVRT